MGLLDAFKQYVKDAAPGGLLNPEVPSGGPTELAKGLLGFTPGIGDAISAYDAVQSARQGNWGEAALNGIGVLPFVPAIGGVLKGSTTKAIEDYIRRSHGGVDLDRSSLSKFTDDSAPLSNTPYGARYVDGEYNPRPNEVLVDNKNGILHFAEEQAQKGYIKHRFVKMQGDNPASVLQVVESPSRVSYHGDKLPHTSRITYGYTKENARGKGAMADLIKYADQSFPVALEPDFWSSPEMIKAYKRSME